MALGDNMSVLSNKDESAHENQIIPAVIMMGFIGVIGAIGNAIVLYVYTKKNDQQTSTLFITALAVVDLGTCVILIPFTMFMEFISYKTDSTVLCKVYYLINSANVPFSSLLMSAIAVDRYLCICHPFSHAMTIDRSKIVILILAVVAAGLGGMACANVSIHAELIRGTTSLVRQIVTSNTTVRVDSTSHNESIAFPVDNPGKGMYYEYKCETNAYVKNTKHTGKFIFYKVSSFVHLSSFLLCILCVIVLYILIFRTVLQIRKRKEKLKGRTIPLKRILRPSVEHDTMTNKITCDCEETSTLNGNQNSSNAKRRSKSLRDSSIIQNLKTAAVLFIVALVFIATFVPAGMMTQEIVALNLIVYYMYYVNNAANPIIYCFMNKNFRQDLVSIFRGSRSAVQKMRSTTNTTGAANRPRSEQPSSGSIPLC